MLRDTCYAFRTFRQNPGFTLVVILSIALGIAANTNGLQYCQWSSARQPSCPGARSAVQLLLRAILFHPDYLDYKDQTAAVFEGVSAHFPIVPASLGGAGEPERVWGQVVSGNYFSVIGVVPALGRGISPEEDKVRGRDAVVVLSHSLWRRRFGADRTILGRTVLLNGQQYTVIGVGPAGFLGADRGIVAEFGLRSPCSPRSCLTSRIPTIRPTAVARG